MFHPPSYCHCICFIIISSSILFVISSSQHTQTSFSRLTESTGKLTTHVKRLRTKSLHNGTLNRPKFFIPTNLPLNKEIKIYIFNEEVKRFTFTINSKLEAPLTLTVTPCSDPIKWTFEFVEDINAKELVSTRKRRRHGKHRQSDEERARRKRHRHDLRQLSNGSQQSNLLLAKYSGMERKSFTDIRRQYAGQYVIQLSSNKRATSCTLILSHFSPHPLLPINDSLSVVSLTHSSATIHWSPSLSEPDYSIDYYVAINQDHNLISYCEYFEQVETLMKNQSLNHSLIKSNKSIEMFTPWPPVLPLIEATEDTELENEVITSPTTPFTRWYERTMAKSWESEQARKNWTQYNIIRLEQANKSANYHHTWKYLNPSTRYFVDVIAINRATKATSLYKGLNLTTKVPYKKLSIPSVTLDVGSKKQKPDLMWPKLTRIRDKRLTTVNLSKQNNFTEIFSYRYNDSDFSVGGNLWLFVQICSTSHSSKVDVTINGAGLTNAVMIRETGIKGSRVINIPMGLKWYNSTMKSSTTKNNQQLLIISLTGYGKLSFDVNLMISKKRSHIPEPQLPRDRSIRVLDLLTTCKSVELAWIASPDDKALYCLYAAPITPDITEKQIHQELKELPGYNLNSTSSARCEYLKNIKSVKGLKSKSSLKKSTKPARFAQFLDKSRYFKRLYCNQFPRLTDSRLDQVIMHTIHHLKPSTEYVFLVEIWKPKGLTAYYNSITTATKSTEMC
ncbi:protein NDNF [Tetranychus urticae]|uniref:protein NDNF n=1 Tax=Tetranychus urticae TaxID=32264 RepID=UPI00077BBDAB|nr:protein NDNF [Tetranychus urticae]